MAPFSLFIFFLVVACLLNIDLTYNHSFFVYFLSCWLVKSYGPFFFVYFLFGGCLPVKYMTWLDLSYLFFWLLFFTELSKITGLILEPFLFIYFSFGGPRYYVYYGVLDIWHLDISIFFFCLTFLFAGCSLILLDLNLKQTTPILIKISIV